MWSMLGKAALLALPITAVIAIPMGILVYRYSQKKINSFDYDFTKEGWIKWESDEQWDSWGQAAAKDEDPESEEDGDPESEKDDDQESEEVCDSDSFKDSNDL